MLYPERIAIDEVTQFELASHIECEESLHNPEVRESLLAQEHMASNSEELELLFPECAKALNYGYMNAEDEDSVENAKVAEYSLRYTYAYGPKQPPIERVGAKWLLSRVMFDVIIAPYADELTTLAKKYDRVY